MQIRSTYGAICLGSPKAHVARNGCSWDAHAALLAMGVIRLPPHSAYTAACAMKLSLVHVIKEVAMRAVVCFSQLLIAFLTRPLRLLNFLTMHAPHCSHGLAIHRMRLLWVLLLRIVDRIVAKAAREELSAAGGE